MASSCECVMALKEAAQRQQVDVGQGIGKGNIYIFNLSQATVWSPALEPSTRSSLHLSGVPLSLSRFTGVPQYIHYNSAIHSGEKKVMKYDHKLVVSKSMQTQYFSENSKFIASNSFSNLLDTKCVDMTANLNLSTLKNRNALTQTYEI